MCEARDGSGTILNQYFPYGQTISASDYFYTYDHLGSVREMTDSSGNIQAQYSYDPYGRITQLQGSLASDFQYAGYYCHAASGLNLAVYRAYSGSLGRWISREPLGTPPSATLYGYVDNDPIDYMDPDGLKKLKPGGPWHPPAGTKTKCILGEPCEKMAGKIWILNKMICSHQKWDWTMPKPRGGNRHQDEMGPFWKQIAECIEMYLNDPKCDPKKLPCRCYGLNGSSD
jgi:RHS repeat-associated protein